MFCRERLGNWEWQTVWCRLAALTSPHSLPFPIHCYCLAHWFTWKWWLTSGELRIIFISWDWKCPVRTCRKQSCDNRTIFSYAIDALNWTDYVMRPWSAVNVGGALEILFVLYCIDIWYMDNCRRLSWRTERGFWDWAILVHSAWGFPSESCRCTRQWEEYLHSSVFPLSSMLAVIMRYRLHHIY